MARHVFCVSVFLASAFLSASPTMADPTGTSGCVASSSMALQQLGITPRSLAAIDASDEQTQAIAAIALSQCESGIVDLAALQTQESALNSEVGILVDHVSRGTATAAERTRLPLARAALAQVRADRDSQLATLSDLISGILSAEQETTLANINAAKDVDVPLEYKVEAHTEAQWTVVRNRLRTDADQPSAAVSDARALISERSGRLADLWAATLGG